MGVPARFNDYAPHTYSRDGTWKGVYTRTHKGSGSTTVTNSQGAVRIIEGECNRLYYTRNPVLEKNGVRYRNDSSYYRHATTYTVGTGKISQKGENSTYRWEQTYEGDFMAFNNPGVEGLWTYPANGSVGGFVPQWDYDLAARTKTECLNKLADQAVDLGQFVVEARETAELLTSASRRLGELLLDLRRGNIKAIPRNFGIVKQSGQYLLEWFYGWKPLCQDIYDLQNLTRSHLQKDQVITATRNLSTHYTKDRSANNSLRNISNRTAVRSRTVLRARLGDEWRYRVNQIGLSNPAAAAWEVVPYSFLIDWGMPVGSFLQALTATNGLVFHSGHTTQVGEASVEATQVYGGYTGDRHISAEGFWMWRDGYRAFPRPMLYGKSPFSTTHTLEAISLWASLRSIF